MDIKAEDWIGSGLKKNKVGKRTVEKLSDSWEMSEAVSQAGRESDTAVKQNVTYRVRYLVLSHAPASSRATGR